MTRLALFTITAVAVPMTIPVKKHSFLLNHNITKMLVKLLPGRVLK